jgi:hypothetical protein
MAPRRKERIMAARPEGIGSFAEQPWQAVTPEYRLELL